MSEFAGFDWREALRMNAAAQLEEEMYELSERCYCASWLVNLEYILWQFVQEGEAREWGIGDISSRELQRLKSLSQNCGGWIAYTRTGGPQFYPLTTWLPMVARAEAKP